MVSTIIDDSTGGGQSKAASEAEAPSTTPEGISRLLQEELWAKGFAIEIIADARGGYSAIRPRSTGFPSLTFTHLPCEISVEVTAVLRIRPTSGTKFTLSPELSVTATDLLPPDLLAETQEIVDLRNVIVPTLRLTDSEQAELQTVLSSGGIQAAWDQYHRRTVGQLEFLKTSELPNGWQAGQEQQ